MNSETSESRVTVKKILKPRQTYLHFPAHFKRNNSNKKKKMNTIFIPHKSSDSLRLVLHNMDTLPILQDSELENMPLKVDVTCNQEINLNLDNYYLRRKLEYICRKNTLNYRAVYTEKGTRQEDYKSQWGLIMSI